MEYDNLDTEELTTQVREIVKTAVHEELKKVGEETIPKMVDDAIKHRIEPVTTALTNLTNVIADVTSGYIAVNAKDMEHDEKLSEIMRVLDYLKARDEYIDGAIKAFSVINKAVEWGSWLIGTRLGKLVLIVIVATLPIIVEGWSEIPNVIIEILNQTK